MKAEKTAFKKAKPQMEAYLAAIHDLLADMVPEPLVPDVAVVWYRKPSDPGVYALTINFQELKAYMLYIPEGYLEWAEGQV